MKDAELKHEKFVLNISLYQVKLKLSTSFLQILNEH